MKKDFLLYDPHGPYKMAGIYFSSRTCQVKNNVDAYMDYQQAGFIKYITVRTGPKELVKEVLNLRKSCNAVVYTGGNPYENFYYAFSIYSEYTQILLFKRKLYSYENKNLITNAKEHLNKLKEFLEVELIL